MEYRINQLNFDEISKPMKTSKSNELKTEKKSVTPVQQTIISKTKLIQKLSREVNKRATERMLKDLILGK
jgi:hypothetical protein